MSRIAVTLLIFKLYVSAKEIPQNISIILTESGLYSYDKNKKFIEVLRYDIGNVQSIADNKVSSIYQDKGLEKSHGSPFSSGTVRSKARPGAMP